MGQYVVAPLWKLPVAVRDNLAISLLFTAIHFVRSYLWRRLFNRRWSE